MQVARLIEVLLPPGLLLLLGHVDHITGMPKFYLHVNLNQWSLSSQSLHRALRVLDVRFFLWRLVVALARDVVAGVLVLALLIKYIIRIIEVREMRRRSMMTMTNMLLW